MNTAQKSAEKPAASMRKIFMLVGAAILIFLAFTAYSVQKAVQGAS
jgi:hypothetical protein